MRVVVRAFNADGYHKDIAVLSEEQVNMHEGRVDGDAYQSMCSGLLGIGCGIDPSKFPEMVRFEVVVKYENRKD